MMLSHPINFGTKVPSNSGRTKRTNERTQQTRSEFTFIMMTTTTTTTTPWWWRTVLIANHILPFNQNQPPTAELRQWLAVPHVKSPSPELRKRRVAVFHPSITKLALKAGHRSYDEKGVKEITSYGRTNTLMAFKGGVTLFCSFESESTVVSFPQTIIYFPGITLQRFLKFLPSCTYINHKPRKNHPVPFPITSPLILRHARASVPA